MNQLPYELSFMHKYNIHKVLGLLIDDYDLRSIARIYGVTMREIKKIENSFTQNISEVASDLKRKFPAKSLDRPYIVAAIGDSLTSDRESYAKILNHLWRDDPKRKIIDCAVSGDTTHHIINRFYSTVLNKSFDWAIIFLGTNDCRELADEAHVSIISFEEYKRNINYITESLLKRNKKIIHVTIPYVDNERLREFFPDANWRYDKKRINITNDFIRKLSNRYKTKLADLSREIDNFKGDVLEPDGIHLNQQGQILLCEMLLKILP